MNGLVKVDDVGKYKIERVNKILLRVPEDVRAATYNALKRAGDAARTKAGQFAAAEYTVSKGTFMANTKNQYSIHYGGGRLSGGLTSVGISFRGSVIPLLSFNTRYSRGGGIQTQVKRSGAAAQLDHVFVARMRGATGAFERVGKERFPVEGKYGPSTAHMMQNEKVIQEMDRVIRETYDKRIEHEILRLMNGW